MKGKQWKKAVTKLKTNYVTCPNCGDKLTEFYVCIHCDHLHCTKCHHKLVKLSPSHARALHKELSDIERASYGFVPIKKWSKDLYHVPPQQIIVENGDAIEALWKEHKDKAPVITVELVFGEIHAQDFDIFMEGVTNEQSAAQMIKNRQEATEKQSILVLVDDVANDVYTTHLLSRST